MRRSNRGIGTLDAALALAAYAAVAAIIIAAMASAETRQATAADDAISRLDLAAACAMATAIANAPNPIATAFEWNYSIKENAIWKNDQRVNESCRINATATGGVMR